MTLAVNNIFTKWEFESESELQQASLLSDLNYKHIQTAIATYAECKMAIEADKLDENFLLKHKFYEGAIEALGHLLIASDAAKTEMQQAFEEARNITAAMNAHFNNGTE